MICETYETMPERIEPYDNAELKPCPFCGSKATIDIIPPHKYYFVDMPDYGGGAFIECTGCSCCYSRSTAEEAIKGWNTRYNEVSNEQ